MIVFMNELLDYLYLVLKGRDAKSLEEAMQITQDEEIEYQSKIMIAKLQDMIEKQDYLCEICSLIINQVE